LSFCSTTTRLYTSNSAAICCANCCGVLPMTSEPVSAIRLATAGSSSVFFAAACSRSTTAGGSPFGTDEAVVGHPVDRLEPDVLERRHALQHRQLVGGGDHDRDQLAVADERQRRRQVVEDDRHLARHHVGERRARAPVRDVRHEGARQRLEQLGLQVPMPPVPELAYECLPGLRRSSSTNDLKSFAGNDGCTAITFGVAARLVIGVKSEVGS
jgi:hypothetical protein